MSSNTGMFAWTPPTLPANYRWPEGGPKRGTCRSCGATIWWAQHERTLKMSPMDHTPPPLERDATAAEHAAAPTITHFATCPNAQRHRGGARR